MASKTTKNNGQPSAKHEHLRSIHFARPVMGVNGKRVSELFEDEAVWKLEHQEVMLGGDGPASPILTPGQAGPPQRAVMPVPFWTVMHFSADRQRRAVLVVPADGATIRVPEVRRREHWMLPATAAEYDVRAKKAREQAEEEAAGHA